MRGPAAEAATALVALAGSAALLAHLVLVRPAELYQDVTSSFWPTALGATLACLSAIRCLQLRLGRAPRGQSGMVPGEAAGAGEIGRSLVMCLLYVLLLDVLGYLVATPLFLLAFMLLLGVRRPEILAGVPAAVTIVSIVLFVKLMYVPLPKGWGVFRAINLLAY